MKTAIVAVLFLIGTSSAAYAEEIAQAPLETLSPELYVPGLHIFAGVGLNTAQFRSESERISLGVGANFKTDVSFFLNEKWAVESSAAVKFNNLEGSTIWDTLLTLGVRRRFTDPLIGYDANYWRVFAGRAPTVINLKHDDQIRFGASRLHLEGTVIGAGLGTYVRTPSNGVHFVEINFTAQQIRHGSNVEMDGQTPVVPSDFDVGHNTRIYSIIVNFGLLVF